ncbi:MAG: hypothetical protein LBV17_03760 [Treponema sp.]|jgi:hypothetical protein|nr:hypothetical protein [Treponema sp.]
MKNFCKLIPVLFWLIGVFPLFAVEADPGVEFNIRFLDRKIYYVESDPIFVQITINNNTPNTYRFKLADERVFSIDFDIRTMTNRRLPESDNFIRKRTEYQQVYFREVAIESGESFSFVENLRDYVKIVQPGSYRVKALVFPELFRASNFVFESNYLALNLRPSAIPGPDGIPFEMDVATGAVLVCQPIPPDEVVSYMITARQQSQWERFFLYLDVEKMISREASQKQRWNSENEEGRKNMVKEYRKNLQNAVIDGDINVIPTSFIIEKTEYNNNEGTVVVLAKFRYSNFTELRRYTYYLERKDNIWKIVNYTVRGIGTEQ